MCVCVYFFLPGFKSQDQGIPSDPVAADHFGSQQGSASSSVYFMPPQDQVVTGSYLPSQGEFISSGSEPAAYAAGLSMPADRRYAAIPEQSETQAAPSGKFLNHGSLMLL